jgi:hypothetical protein
MKPFRILLLAGAVGLASFTGFLVYAAQIDTVRQASWPDAFQKANGKLIHRFTLTPDNSTAESNLTAAGGTAVTYTLFGGERICLQAVTTDAYIEVIAAASVTASGAKGFTLTAGQSPFANCFTLETGDLSVSALCTAAGPCLVKGFEQK